jgi:hypothetical protein
MSTDSDLACEEEKKNESPPFDFEVNKCDSELSSKNDSSSENDEE